MVCEWNHSRKSVESFFTVECLEPAGLSIALSQFSRRLPFVMGGVFEILIPWDFFRDKVSADYRETAIEHLIKKLLNLNTHFKGLRTDSVIILKLGKGSASGTTFFPHQPAYRSGLHNSHEIHSYDVLTGIFSGDHYTPRPIGRLRGSPSGPAPTARRRTGAAGMRLILLAARAVSASYRAGKLEGGARGSRRSHR